MGFCFCVGDTRQLFETNGSIRMHPTNLYGSLSSGLCAEGNSKRVVHLVAQYTYTITMPSMSTGSLGNILMPLLFYTMA